MSSTSSGGASVILLQFALGVDLGVAEQDVQAAINDAREVGSTLLSMNIALAAVFLSILFLDEFVARLFREFSLTLVAAMAVSRVVALSLVPSLSARLLACKRDKNQKEGPQAAGLP